MAEPTINLGNGNWAGKTDNLLGYYKEGERFYKQDFTFSRTTTGTYTDSDGYIQEMPYNLASYSEDYTNSLQGASTTFGTITSPTSKLNASTITTIANGTYKGWNESYSLIGSTDYTFSFYVKYKNKQWLSFYHIGSAITKFDVQNGIFGSNSIGMTKEDVGDGWYRLSGTITASSGTNYFYVYNSGQNDQNSSIGDAFYLFGIQLVKGTSAKTYFPTTTRLNIPRVDYLNNSNGSLILEPQRTNLLPYSDFSSGFTTTNVTLSNNQGTSPDGTSNATKALMASGTGSHRVYDAISSSLNDDNVISVFIKEQNDISHIGLAADTMSNQVWFSGLDGSIINANGLDAKTESFGNGWHRISVYYVADANDAGDNQFIYFSNRENTSPNVAFDGTEEILLYGIQAEKGKYLTTLINTSGSSVTRNADGCELTNVADRINSSEGVLFAEISALVNDGTNRILSLSEDGNNNNRVTIFYTSGSNRIKFTVRLNGSNEFDEIITLSNILDYNKVALKFAENNFAVYINGVKEEQQLSGSTYSANTLDKLSFDKGNDTFDFYGKCKQIQVYNTALSDSELQELTTL
jgi:hypothetical protein